MNTCFSINSMKIGKLLKRYKLTSRGKNVIIKVVKKKKSSTCFGLIRLARKIGFKGLNINKKKQL